MQWTDKYRPQSFKDIIGNNSVDDSVDNIEII